MSQNQLVVPREPSHQKTRKSRGESGVLARGFVLRISAEGTERPCSMRPCYGLIASDARTSSCKGIISIGNDWEKMKSESGMIIAELRNTANVTYTARGSR